MPGFLILRGVIAGIAAGFASGLLDVTAGGIFVPVVSRYEGIYPSPLSRKLDSGKEVILFWSY